MLNCFLSLFLVLSVSIFWGWPWRGLITFLLCWLINTLDCFYLQLLQPQVFISELVNLAEFLQLLKIMVLMNVHFSTIHDPLYSRQMIENIFIEDYIINCISILYLSQSSLRKISYLRQLYLQMIVFIAQFRPYLTDMFQLLAFLIDEQLMKPHVKIM